MRVQAGADANGYVVEYFDSSFTITGRKIVPQELPLFGGFYEMNGNYYILSGQTNKNESDSVEVYRITKYRHAQEKNLPAPEGADRFFREKIHFVERKGIMYF